MYELRHEVAFEHRSGSTLRFAQCSPRCATHPGIRAGGPYLPPCEPFAARAGLDLDGTLILGAPADHSTHRGNHATVAHMSLIASRDLRNHTADVLRRVAAGDHVTITVNGTAVAELGPVSTARRPTISKADLITLLHRHQADAGMRNDLADLTADTTADLDPLQ